MWRWTFVLLVGCSNAGLVDLDGLDGASTFALTILDAPSRLDAGQSSSLRVSVLRVTGKTSPIGAISFSLSEGSAGFTISGEIGATEREGLAQLQVASSVVSGHYSLTLLGLSDGRASVVPFDIDIVGGMMSAGVTGPTTATGTTGPTTATGTMTPSVSYATNPARYFVGQAIATNAATLSHPATLFASDPQLPSALSLNPLTGSITGTPAAASDADYLITAQTSAGNASVTLHITIDVPCAAQCVPNAPSGWLGPIALTGNCNGAFPTPEITVHANAPQFSNASCYCQCDYQVNSGFGIDYSCTGACDSMCSGNCTQSCNIYAQTMPAGGGCVLGPAASGHTSEWITINRGSCNTTPTATTGPVGYTGDLKACTASAVAGVCANASDVCQPALSGGKRCIYQAGNTASCPSDYPFVTHTFSGETDSRGCPACNCALDTYNVVFTSYSNSDCTGAMSGHTFTSPEYMYCTPAAGYSSAKITSTGTCTSYAPTPTGTVTATGDYTFCCAN